MAVRVPGLKNADGKVGFSLLENDNYILEIKECTLKELPNGRTNYRFNCMVMGNATGDMDDDLHGNPYNEFIFLLDPEEEWFSIGLNKLKNAFNAFGVPMKGDTPDLDVSNWDSLQAIAKVRTTKPKSYEKNGKTITPEPRNEVAEWFTIEDED